MLSDPITLYKLMILYMLDHVNFPLTDVYKRQHPRILTPQDSCLGVVIAEVDANDQFLHSFVLVTPDGTVFSRSDCPSHILSCFLSISGHPSFRDRDSWNSEP